METEKTNKGISIVLFILGYTAIVLTISFLLGRRYEKIQPKTNESIKIDSINTFNYLKLKDSLLIQYDSLSKVNNKLQNNIYKLYKENEKNKKRIDNAPDSIKFYIADSILRSAGKR